MVLLQCFKQEIVLNELNIQMKKRRMHSVKIITFALNNICVIKINLKLKWSVDILIILIIIWRQIMMILHKNIVN